MGALKIISDHIIKNRWEEVREPNDGELAGTSVLKLEISEASAKIREGGPVDEKEDYKLDIWAGVVPIKSEYQPAVHDELLKEGVPMPESVLNLHE